jgi:hypothetical protein
MLSLPAESFEKLIFSVGLNYHSLNISGFAYVHFKLFFIRFVTEKCEIKILRAKTKSERITFVGFASFELFGGL